MSADLMARYRQECYFLCAWLLEMANVPEVTGREPVIDTGRVRARLLAGMEDAITGAMFTRAQIDTYADVAAYFAARRLSDNTRRRYRIIVDHFNWFVAMCGHSIEQPTPQHVVLYFGYLIDRGRARPAANGDNYEPLSASHLAVIRACLHRHFRQLGIGIDEQTRGMVGDMIGAYANDHPTDLRQAAAFTLDDLTVLNEHLTALTPRNVRDRAMFTILADPRQQVTMPQLARLRRWSQVEWGSGPDQPVILRYAGETVRLRPAADPDVCPVRHLWAWADRSTSTVVFPNGAGNPVTIDAIRHRYHALHPHTDGRRLAPGQLRQAVRSIRDIGNLQAAAFILTGVFGQFRCAELSNLDWPDVTFDNDGMQVRVVRSKTNRTGRPNYVPISRRNDGRCPVHALEQWKAMLGPDLDVCPAVFVDPRQPERRLRPEGFHDQIVRITNEVFPGRRLPPGQHYGGHSMRATLPTIALDNSQDMNRVALHARRADTSSQLRYLRLRNPYATDPGRLI